MAIVGYTYILMYKKRESNNNTKKVLESAIETRSKLLKTNEPSKDLQRQHGNRLTLLLKLFDRDFYCSNLKYATGNFIHGLYHHVGNIL